MTDTDTTPPKPSALQVLGKALLWGLAGAVIAPLTVITVTLIVNAFNPVCGTPGDSGGCEMGLALTSLGSIMPGAAIAFAIAAMRGFGIGRRRNNTYLMKALGMKPDEEK
jgi:hypothetical protein